MMLDTMDALQLREPLSIGSLGSVFWSESYLSSRIVEGPEGRRILPWVKHYSIPRYGGLTIDVRLSAPLRTDEGFENVDINIDRLMGTIERDYTRDWRGAVAISDLSIPMRLIERLEALLREWQGERLMIHYNCLPEEGDPLTIWAEFGGCRRPPTIPDAGLLYIAQELHRAMN